MREFLGQFLLYSRAERRAVIALTVLIMLVLFIPRAYRFYHIRRDTLPPDTALMRRLALSMVDTGSVPVSDSVRKALFSFDPNTITTKDWIRLGLSEKQAEVIQKYKAKGGRFYKPEDLRKIYVLSDTTKELLIPWVRIPGAKPPKGGAGYVIEVNTADSAAYEALYGIGPVLASRIVRFRRLLGGFCRIEQVAETYGISDSTFLLIKPHLKVNPALVSRIDINSADYEVLRKHPYIHARIAHAIIAYRNRNGKFDKLEQLKTLKPVTDPVYDKIAPYLKVMQ